MLSEVYRLGARILSLKQLLMQFQAEFFQRLKAHLAINPWKSLVQV